LLLLLLLRERRLCVRPTALAAYEPTAHIMTGRALGSLSLFIRHYAERRLIGASWCNLFGRENSTLIAFLLWAVFPLFGRSRHEAFTALRFSAYLKEVRIEIRRERNAA
jgi:hypothetical protein